jgi:serine phosphatase RsbU (regulator of sigma subunit)
VGGDYFGYIPLSDGRVAVAVGDVAGKGLPAALLMARLSAETRACLREAATPAAAVERLNTFLASAPFFDRFVTLVLAVLDPRRHEITLVNASHPEPLLRRANGEVVRLGIDERGLPLGLDADQAYKETRYDLEPGDVLLMYTDGISEAENAKRELYGPERLRRIVGQGTGTAVWIGEAVVRDVVDFL